MRRFWVGSLANESDISIEGDLFHHICEVCRFKVGSKFELMTGDGRAHLVELTDIGRRKAQAQKLEERVVPELPKPWLNLCVSLPKYSKMDLIVEKAVELGVKTIRPFVSDYSFVQKLSKIPDSKVPRWEKIIQGATQQSGRGELMAMENVVTLENLLVDFNHKTKAQGLFLYEGESTLWLKSALNTLKSSNLDEIWAFIGSEGGFSTQEVDVFERHGLAPITLGSQILRVETACVALAGIIKYEFESLEVK